MFLNHRYKRSKSFKIRNLLSDTIHGGFIEESKLNEKQCNYFKNNKKYAESEKFKCEACGDYHKTNSSNFHCPVK